MRTLTLSLIAIVFIATIGLGWMFDEFFNQYNDNEISNINDPVLVSEQFAKNLALTIDSYSNYTQRQHFIEQWQTIQDNKQQLTIIASESLPLPPNLLLSLQQGQPLTLEMTDTIAIHVWLKNSEEILVLSLPNTKSAIDHDNTGLVLTGVFYIALLGLFLLWLYPLVSRLLHLRRAAKSFGEGKLSQRVSVGKVSYIRDLELEFNRMAQRIEDLVNDVKLLSSAVSHDLRTPLARIRFGLDTLEEETDPLLREKFQKRISDNVDEMVDLVETLLKYARLDQAMIQLNKSELALTPLINSAINNKSIAGKTIQFKQSANSDIIMADSAYIMIVINNLLQNAIQYSHSIVDISLTEQYDKLVLSFADDGDGIAPEQRQAMLKPFTRGESTNKKIKGYGMGLAIVKRILEWHNAEIKIGKAELLGGAEISIIFVKK